ncbi:MAG: family transcriptional regulator, cyclic receptor protein [Gaiellaceae bacterium]|nr:family transcriptional regulator, cyclic receptor protein [Gaiellaceae bacterium]
MRREQPGERDGDGDEAEQERAEDPRPGTPKPSRRRGGRVTRERLESRDRHTEKDQQQTGKAGRSPENGRNDTHRLTVANRSEGSYSRQMRLGKDGKVELIKKVPLFSKLSKKGLEEVAHIADELDLPQGKVMAEEGDRGREFFVLLEGQADVTKGDRSINTMKQGDFFGEIALVTKMPRTASVTATTDVRVLVITERDFSSLLKHSEDVGRAVAEALAERVAPDLPV